MRALALLLALGACGAGGQAPECEKYLACSEAVATPASPAPQQTYGRGGACWQNASDAAACTEICTQALMILKAGSGSSKPECN